MCDMYVQCVICTCCVSDCTSIYNTSHSAAPRGELPMTYIYHYNLLTSPDYKHGARLGASIASLDSIVVVCTRFEWCHQPRTRARTHTTHVLGVRTLPRCLRKRKLRLALARAELVQRRHPRRRRRVPRKQQQRRRRRRQPHRLREQRRAKPPRPRKPPEPRRRRGRRKARRRRRP